MIFILRKKQILLLKVDTSLLKFPLLISLNFLFICPILLEIAKRGPLRDDDCYWDYGKARCAWPEHCEYRFIVFISKVMPLNISFDCHDR